MDDLQNAILLTYGIEDMSAFRLHGREYEVTQRAPGSYDVKENGVVCEALSAREVMGVLAS